MHEGDQSDGRGKGGGGREGEKEGRTLRAPGPRRGVLVNSRKERSVAAALCYLTALPAVILLGLYCQASLVGKGGASWWKRDGEKDRCIRKQGASVPRRRRRRGWLPGWLAGWLAGSFVRSLVRSLVRLLACTCEKKRTPRDRRAGPGTRTHIYT